MPETLDSIAAKIAALSDHVDRRHDETRSALRTYIEAVDTKVGLVLEKVDDLIKRDMRHTAARVRFDDRLDNHELRLMVLESEEPASDD